MRSRPLDEDEIGRLTKVTPQQINATTERIYKWPGWKNMKVLAQAAAERQPFVYFDGKRFSIRYGTHFGGTIFVRPDGADIRPCGYFSLKKLEDMLEDE